MTCGGHLEDFWRTDGEHRMRVWRTYDIQRTMKYTWRTFGRHLENTEGTNVRCGPIIADTFKSFSLRKVFKTEHRNIPIFPRKIYGGT